MYGWLWWATHERKETVTGLAIWYLGAGDPKDVVMPVEEMESMDRDLFELYSKIRGATHLSKNAPQSRHLFGDSRMVASPMFNQLNPTPGPDATGASMLVSVKDRTKSQI